MKYLIMECKQSYAVSLDEEGKFIKIANLGYSVGETVSEVIPFEYASEKTEKKPKMLVMKKHIVAIVAAAACFMFMILGGWYFIGSSVGTVQITINPEVEISVNRLDYAVGLAGLNADGEDLIRDVSYFGKKVSLLSDELADKAMAEGYLSDGGRIKVTINSRDVEWKTAHEDMIIVELEVHLGNRVEIVTGEDDIVIDVPSHDTTDEAETASPPETTQPPVIQVPPETTVSPATEPPRYYDDDRDDDDDDWDDRYDDDDDDDDDWDD